MANNIEYHPLSVARHYLRTWFMLDLISGIPFTGLDLIVSLSSGGNEKAADVPLLKLVKSLRLLRFLKLIRLLKIEEMTSNLVMDRDTIDRIEDFFQEGSTRSGVILLSLAMQLGFICHIAACIWTYIGRRGAINGDHTWFAYEESGPYSEKDTTGGDNVSSIYLAAFYYSLTTMTSVGYGDIIPRSDSERTYAICLEFIGGFVFAMIIASLTSVVTSSDMNQRKVSEQLDSVSSFVQNRQFPQVLGRRIRRHFRQFYSHKSAIDERKIFGEMSSALRRDVSSYIVSVRMSDVKLFQSMNPKLWPRLFPLLNPTHFELGEHVCTQGEESSEMFIILDGSLSGQTLIDTQMIAGREAAKDSVTGNNGWSPAGGQGRGNSDESNDSNRSEREGEPCVLVDARPKVKSLASMDDFAEENMKQILAEQRKSPKEGVEEELQDMEDESSDQFEHIDSPLRVKPIASNFATPTTPTFIKKTFSALLDSSTKSGREGNNLPWFSGSSKEMQMKKEASIAQNSAGAGHMAGIGKRRGSGGRRGTFSAATFINGSWRNKSSSEKVKMRHIGPGDSVNVLCVVQVWNKCVETVIAETNVETYCVNADEFNTLFNHDSLVDVETFNEMRIQEVANFRMDLTQPAPTIFGVPLYMTFSCVSCTVVAARGILAADSNLIGANTSDPYATIELVDYDTGRIVNSQWFMRIPTKRKTLTPVWTEKHTSRWRDIHLPFETLGLRITLYDEDVMEDDDKLGEVYLRVSDLDLEDEDCPFFRVPDKRLLNINTDKAREVIKNSEAVFALSANETMDDSKTSKDVANGQPTGQTKPPSWKTRDSGFNERDFLAEFEDGSDSDIELKELHTQLNSQSSRSMRTESSSPGLNTPNPPLSSMAQQIINSFKSGSSNPASPDSGYSSVGRGSGSRRSFGKFTNDSIMSTILSRDGADTMSPTLHSDNWDKIRVASKFTSPMSPGRAWGGILSALTKKVGIFDPSDEDEDVSEEDEMMLEQLDAQVAHLPLYTLSLRLLSLLTFPSLF